MQLFTPFLLCFLIIPALFAQELPQRPNQMDAQGLRQGEWVIYLDFKNKPREDTRWVYSYRLVTYRDGKIVGAVKEFNRQGQLLTMADTYLSMFPDSLDGQMFYYLPNGQVYATYLAERGKIKKSTYYNLDGRIPKFDFEQLIDSAKQHWYQGRYKDALTVFEASKEQARAQFGKDSQQYATSIDNMGLTFKVLGDYQNAQEYHEKAWEIRREVLGPKHPHYAVSCANMAGLYRKLGDYTRAEALFREAKAIDEIALGKNDPEYATDCNNLGLLMENLGRLTEAEALYKEALTIMISSKGKKSPQYLSISGNLAGIYQSLGRYEQAEKMYQFIMDTYAELYGKTHPNYGRACNNLATLYTTEGYYSDAEALLVQTKEIWEKAYGKKHVRYLIALNNLASLYQGQGLYQKAVDYFKEARGLVVEILGEDHPYNSTVLKSLGQIYTAQGKYELAEEMYLKVKATRLEKLGRDNLRYSFICNDLALLYMQKQEFHKAEAQFEEAVRVYQNAIGQDTPEFARILKSQGQNFLNQRKYKASLEKYEQAETILKTILGADHPEYASIAFSLANYYREIEELSKAKDWYKKAVELDLSELKRNFVGLSEVEQKKYLRTHASVFNEVFSFCVDSRMLLSEFLNLRLALKGRLLDNSQKIRDRILSSPDSNLVKQFNQWQDRKNQMAQAAHLSPKELAKRSIDLNSWQEEINQLEKALGRSSEDFAQKFQEKEIHWRDIQALLNPQEAALEVVRLTYMKPKQLGIDTLYAVLAFHPQSKSKPDLILLRNAAEMEGRALNEYRNRVKYRLEDSRSYGLYWQSIAAYLKKNKIKKVYFSPDGIYNLINLNTLLNPKTGQYLLEEIDVHIISNLKDLLQPRKTDTGQKEIILLGRPDYKLTSEAPRSGKTGPHQLSQNELASLSRQLAEQVLADLPGTETEVHKIAQSLEAKQQKHRVYLKEEALEANIKKVKSPRVLHLASHGFFMEPGGQSPAQQEGVSSIQVDPMLLSGIALAGISAYYQSPEKPATEDGLLSAYEASNLQLDGTELVVLSACETARGKLSHGEGVYGLQRGFQAAGARNILMSLWKVDDKATQELMSTFYDLWLSGKEKRKAFREAQQMLKEKYPHPYFWGAFVMVGE